ncbi:MAG: DUF975 family protein [Ruminococcus sp.]|nr:DUF975 family protein [Ruminococcus sp.]
MWSREMLKKNAWNSLKGYYWMAFLVCFVAQMLGGGTANTSSSFSFPSSSMTELTELSSEDPESIFAVLAILAMVFVIFIITYVFVMAFALAIYAFLGGPVEVGKCKFFQQARTGDVNFSYLFHQFGGGRYMNTVKVQFFRMLYTTLWSMLFWVPGIIKGLEYFLIPYLMAENPNMSKDRAFEISRKTMDGEKWNLFVLQLSFIGWVLLGIMACCIGTYFVVPYQQATFAEFYACMRAKMIAQGITTEQELTGCAAYVVE